MRLLLCLDGTNTEQLLTTVIRLLALGNLSTPSNPDAAGAPSLRLLHVLDSGHAEQAGFFRERYVGRAGMGSDWHMQVDAAARVRGEETLREAATRLAELFATPPAGAATLVSAPAPPETLLLAGRPEREIVRSAGEWPAALVALCARRPDGPPRPPGPHSVGHVARFVVDHAPCPVLLVRG